MITITMPVIKLCPCKDEIDAGELAITRPDDSPELHNLAWDVYKLCAEPVTHEDFTRRVLALVPRPALVVTRWQTGPWSVECREGDEELAA